jgi:hypothetical protein
MEQDNVTFNSWFETFGKFSRRFAYSGNPVSFVNINR